MNHNKTINQETEDYRKTLALIVEIMERKGECNSDLYVSARDALNRWRIKFDHEHP